MVLHQRNFCFIFGPVYNFKLVSVSSRILTRPIRSICNSMRRACFVRSSSPKRFRSNKTNKSGAGFRVGFGLKFGISLKINSKPMKTSQIFNSFFDAKCSLSFLIFIKKIASATSSAKAFFLIIMFTAVKSIMACKICGLYRSCLGCKQNWNSGRIQAYIFWV